MPGRCCRPWDIAGFGGPKCNLCRGGSYGNLSGQAAPLAIVPGLPSPELLPRLRQTAARESVAETSAVALEDPLCGITTAARTECQVTITRLRRGSTATASSTGPLMTPLRRMRKEHLARMTRSVWRWLPDWRTMIIMHGPGEPFAFLPTTGFE